ncbi:DUF2303 family protein [Mongoliimonas terrestris]|uniref:DUF2303 family protein n=1 Tax=Mongoliimonas terrestris TaxID=1709001 RepID=UPI0009F9FD51|nr:DUF2303 family protein [Mongoliimonas terrestris]
MTDETQAPPAEPAGTTLYSAEPLQAVSSAVHLEGDTIDRIADLGRRAAGAEIDFLDMPEGIPGVPECVPVQIIHGDQPAIRSLRPLVDEWRRYPERKVGTAKAYTLDSFIELSEYHATEHSVVFADTDWRKPVVTTVVDYHQDYIAGGWPDHGKHRIVYAFPLSEEWKAWTGQDGKPMEQAEFAAFLEDRIADLASPLDQERADYERLFSTKLATPAELIQLSRGLSVNVESKVANHVLLQSGEGQIVFEETHKDSAGNLIKVPGLFILQVAPFFMGELVRIPVRLRYRVKAGSLVWFYQIYRPDLHITERVRTDLDKVREKLSAATVVEGAPEMPGA